MPDNGGVLHVEAVGEVSHRSHILPLELESLIVLGRGLTIELLYELNSLPESVFVPSLLMLQGTQVTQVWWSSIDRFDSSLKHIMSTPEF